MAKVRDYSKDSKRKTKVIYKETAIKLSADLAAEALQARIEWHDMFKLQKGKNMQPSILYLERLLFKIEGELKNSDKQKLGLSNTKPTLKQMFKSLC